MPYSCFCIVTSHQNLFCCTFVKWLDCKRWIANKIHVYTFFALKHLYSLWFVMGNGNCSMIPALVHTASSTLFAHVCGSYWLILARDKQHRHSTTLMSLVHLSSLAKNQQHRHTTMLMSVVHLSTLAKNQQHRYSTVLMSVVHLSILARDQQHRYNTI